MEHLQRIKFLGMGKFSEVYLVKNITSNDLLVAKKIYLANIKDLKEQAYIQNELRFYLKLKIIILYNYIILIKLKILYIYI